MLAQPIRVQRKAMCRKGEKLVGNDNVTNDDIIVDMIQHIYAQAGDQPVYRSYSAFMTPTGKHYPLLLQKAGNLHTSFVLPRDNLRGRKLDDYGWLLKASDVQGASVRVGSHPHVETRNGLDIQDFYGEQEKIIMSFLHIKAILIIFEPSPGSDYWRVSYSVFTAPGDRTASHKYRIAATWTGLFSPTLPYEQLPFAQEIEDMTLLCPLPQNAPPMKLSALEKIYLTHENHAQVKAIIPYREVDLNEPMSDISWLTPYSGPTAYQGNMARLANIIHDAKDFAMVGTEWCDLDCPVINALLESKAPQKVLCASACGQRSQHKHRLACKTLKEAGVIVKRNELFSFKMLATESASAVLTGNFVARTGECKNCSFVDGTLDFAATIAECLGVVVGGPSELLTQFVWDLPVGTDED